MRHKNKWGILFLAISAVFLLMSFNPNLSGGLIGINTNLSLNFIFGLAFLIIALILFIQKSGLEYLVIPVGLEKWQNLKAKSATKTIETGHIDQVVITGDIEGEKRRYKEHDEHRLSVYDAVRKAGIRPGQVRLLHGRDSEEDILYLGRMVKPGDTIYFDTFPLHFQEYKTLIKKAQRDKKFSENVTLRNARIPQGRTEIAYGLMGWLEEVFKRRPLDYKKNRESDALDKFKGVVKKLIGA